MIDVGLGYLPDLLQLLFARFGKQVLEASLQFQVILHRLPGFPPISQQAAIIAAPPFIPERNPAEPDTRCPCDLLQGFDLDAPVIQNDGLPEFYTDDFADNSTGFEEWIMTLQI